MGGIKGVGALNPRIHKRSLEMVEDVQTSLRIVSLLPALLL